MANGEKRGNDRNTKMWISRERKELFRSNKNNFSYLFKGYRVVKKWKIADASFKVTLNYSIIDRVWAYSHKVDELLEHGCIEFMNYYQQPIWQN